MECCSGQNKDSHCACPLRFWSLILVHGLIVNSWNAIHYIIIMFLLSFSSKILSHTSLVFHPETILRCGAQCYIYAILSSKCEVLQVLISLQCSRNSIHIWIIYTFCDIFISDHNQYSNPASNGRQLGSSQRRLCLHLPGEFWITLPPSPPEFWTMAGRGGGVPNF